MAPDITPDAAVEPTIEIVDTMVSPPLPDLGTPPWWVLYLLWPVQRVLRRFHLWTVRIDIRVKIAICRWLGIIDSFSAAKSVDHGLRQDLDYVAKTLGDLIPVVNSHTPLLKDLRGLHQRELLAIDRRRPRHPEPETHA